MSEKATTADKNAAAIERWPIAKVTPYARNARTVPETAIVKVAASIREFGFKTPMLVEPDGTIIAGHTRLLAAMRLGLETVPVIVCADLSDAQAKALRLADNRTAQETGWDMELLAIEMADLSSLDFDTSLTGFDVDEIAPKLPDPGDQSVSDPAAVWGVIVECDSETEQISLLASMSEQGYRVRALIG